jgi:hypothetical protein
MVTLDFVDVRWDVELTKDAFNYTPPEKIARQDVTQAYINRFAPPEQDETSKASTEQSATE